MVSNAKNDDKDLNAAETVTLGLWMRNRSFYHIIKNVIKCKMMSQKEFDKGIEFFRGVTPRKFRGVSK